jgi:hypothetical protein
MVSGSTVNPQRAASERCQADLANPTANRPILSAKRRFVPLE